MQRLLLISCSGTKKHDPFPMQALARYDGTTYKIIKKAKREGYWPQRTDLFIISAKYGLISEDTFIEDYDQKMSKVRALELQSEVSQALDTLFLQKGYTQIFVNMGNIYTQSVACSREFLKARQDGILQEAVGGIGERLQQTKMWLIKTANAAAEIPQ
jgi:hypothetical protein